VRQALVVLAIAPCQKKNMHTKTKRKLIRAEISPETLGKWCATLLGSSVIGFFGLGQNVPGKGNALVPSCLPTGSSHVGTSAHVTQVFTRHIILDAIQLFDY